MKHVAEVNDDKLKGKWLEIKGNIQKAWGKLTDDELEQTKGDIKSIGGLIQQRYGTAKENYSAKLSHIFREISEEKDKAVSSIKSHIKTS